MRAVPVDPTGRELTLGVPKLILDDERIVVAVSGTGGDLFAVREEDPRSPAEVRVVVGWPGAVRQPLARAAAEPGGLVKFNWNFTP